MVTKGASRSQNIIMAEDFDVEAMLEAPYRKGDELTGTRSHQENGSSDHKSSRKSRHRSRSRDRHVTNIKSKDRRSRSRERDRRRSKSKGKDRRSKSKDKDHHRKRSKDRSGATRHKSRSRSKDRSRRKRSLTPILLPGRREPFPRFKKASPPIGLRTGPIVDDLSPEERDARTVFCMQLSQRIRSRDLEEFFSSVGKVRDVRLITCNKTRRFKGIAYIEFKDPESVPLALGLNGQKLLGVPIIVQQTQAEKNRAGNSMPNIVPRGIPGPMRLYVGSLHFNITEDMLRGIFEPFGKIDNIQLIQDSDGRSKGYGFITFRNSEDAQRALEQLNGFELAGQPMRVGNFHNSEDAKRALEQLNGFELAGRPMKVGNVTERADIITQGPSALDSDELDRSGIDLGATGRLQLMFKLAEGPQVKDSYSGQNKNNVIFKFYHRLVQHKEIKFKKVTTYFPESGHSYNECDKNTGLIKYKSEAELPEDWTDIRSSRHEPSSFDAIVVEQLVIQEWASHLNQMCRKKPGRATRPEQAYGGTGMQIPAAAASALNLNAVVPGMPLPVVSQPTPPIATQCFMLANMFDPLSETNPSWDIEIRDDVIEECNKHGGVLHVYVDKASPQGNVYVKCPNINTAVAAVNSLHGRWFAGRVITAAYVPLINYHSLFPDTITAMQLLAPSRRPL